MQEIKEWAHRLGLQVFIWAPGDGARRYQFVRSDGHPTRVWVGSREALAFLAGVEYAQPQAPPEGGTD